MSNWQDMFERKSATSPLAEMGGMEDPDPTAVPPPDPQEYRPWLLQRGRGRPSLFIDLRRFEPRTGTLIGCQVSYPHLLAVEYWGDRMVSLDFGTRHYVIEGSGLVELPMWLQQGLVIAIQEHSSTIWPHHNNGPIVKKIVPLHDRSKPSQTPS